MVKSDDKILALLEEKITLVLVTIQLSAMKSILIAILVFLSISFVNQPEDPCISGKTYIDIEEAIKDSASVKVLDLALQDPKLKTLPADVLKLTHVECLDLSFNQIANLPTEMMNLKQLKTLNLAGNRYLQKLPDVVKELPALQTLILTDLPEWSKEKCDAAKAALLGVNVITDK